MANKQQTSKRTVRRAERDAEIIALRLGGATYRDIASRLDVSPGGAYKAIQRHLQALAKQAAEAVDEMRRLEGERLDTLQAGQWPAAVSGDGQAVGAVLKIMERRARLFALDTAKGEGAAPWGPSGPIERVIVEVHKAPDYGARQGTDAPGPDEA